MSKLLLVEGPDRGELFTLLNDAKIGRSRSCDIRLLGRHISRVHAKIEQKGEDFFVSDAESRNGIFVNGEKVTNHKLQPDDELEVGEFILVFDPTFDFSEGIPEKRPRMTAKISETLHNAFANHSSDANPAAELDRLRTVMDIVRTIYTLRDEKAAMKALLEKVLAEIPAKRGFVMLAQKGSKLTPVAKSAPKEMAEFHVSNIFHHRVSRINEGLLGSDLGRYGPLSGKIINILCVPLISQDRYLGFLYLDGPAEESIFRSYNLQFCMMLATFIADLLARNQSGPVEPQALPSSEETSGDPFEEIWAGRESVEQHLQTIEQNCLEEAVRKMKGNMTLAAELLKMDQDTLAEKLKKNPPPAPTWQSVEP
ncbi:MAG: FHA domain-containing protein [Planctomycetota bacterium]|nr:FHA domain-containing protein [Planctomycetota bacterium]